MNLILKIALKYFPISRKISFINVIALISMLVVTLITTSIILVMSVFNGMEDLIRDLYKSFDAEIKITSKEGKSFIISDSLINYLNNHQNIAYYTEIIEDNAVAQFGDKKEIVKIKGVSNQYLLNENIKKIITDGTLKFYDDDIVYALIGVGLQYKLEIPLNSKFDNLNLYYPNKKKLTKGNPLEAFNNIFIKPGAAFALEKSIDDYYVIIPLNEAEQLMGYNNRRTSIEIESKNNTKSIIEDLNRKFGDKFIILDRDQQHAALYRAIKIEKFVVFIILVCLLGVSAIGIYFSLSMISIKKQKDIAILKALGIQEITIKEIFITEGIIIGSLGAMIGLLIGFGICAAQQYWGLVPLGMDSSIVEAYPIKMNIYDFVYTAIVVFILTYVAAQIPAIKASKTSIKDQI